RFDLKYPFRTFDYRQLCQILLDRVDAEVVIARVKSVQDHGILTDKGFFESDRIVDATGWRATLASSVKADYAAKRQMSFGLETEVPYRAEGLQFWTDRKVLKNDAVTWIFPAGEFSRIGISSYSGRTNLNKGLENFLSGLGLSLGEEIYGGYFPWSLLEPTVGDIFVVGDAAGQCFGLSGEGIRSSLYFGQICGQIVQKAIEGDLTLAEAQRKYRAVVKRHAIYFRAMHALQRLFPHLSDLELYLAGGLIGLKPVLYFLMWQYWKGSDPDLLSPGPRVKAT
ncbi:MAG: hypothetical protein Q7O66_12900, partial [Dehalococcoidia bacterium]|nr:hypothetical protein [Dehalococcoidia bacterium]